MIRLSLPKSIPSWSIPVLKTNFWVHQFSVRHSELKAALPLPEGEQACLARSKEVPVGQQGHISGHLVAWVPPKFRPVLDCPYAQGGFWNL